MDLVLSEGCSRLAVDLSDRTNPDDVIRAYGTCLGSAISAVDHVHAYVTWLRSKQYRIADEDEMQRVKEILKTGFSASDTVISTYARTLRSLLSCEVLPAKFSITNSIQVANYELHDEVDCLFHTKEYVDGRWTTKSEWFAGVVVNKRAATSADNYEVFWVGHKPCRSGVNKNPTWVSVHILRRHIDGTAVGSDEEWLNLQKIRGFHIEPYIPQPPKPKPRLTPIPARKSSRVPIPVSNLCQKEKKKRVTDEEVVVGDQEEVDDGEEDESTDQEDDDGDEEEEASDDVAMIDNEEEEVDDNDEEEDDHPQARFRTMLQVFKDVDKAIVTLMGLHSGLPAHASLFDDLSSSLISVAHFAAEHYCNSAYDSLASTTLTELASYEGQENVKLPHSTKFLESLSAYGFCVTTRLWTREEILCLAIAILDPRLNFTGINPKDGVNSQTSYRGMAHLDPRIQRIFYERLRSYGFVNPRFHPEKLQAFSSVVINGGGSWQQDTFWEFPLGTRFQMDSTAVPFMFEVSAGIGALEADGVYVASTSRKNGKPVYIQVSKQEYKGFAGQVGFEQCLKPQLRTVLKSKFLDSQGNRLDACSPRVFLCLSGSKWGIQMLPAYGSDFCIFELNWLEQTCHIEANAFCYLEFDEFEARWQKCSVSVNVICSCSTDVIQNHQHAFSFGPVKVANLKARKKQAPTPLRPQGFHTDGPIRFNRELFSCKGKLHPNAPSCSKKRPGLWIDLWDNPLNEFLPQHFSIMQESFSALFGVFAGTYIQTPASESAKRKDTVLNVNTPLGCAVVFTFAWKHRGKGDDGHVVKNEAPVAVHARPHLYCFSSDLRRFPTVDLEACLEFLSVCAQKQPDAGSGLFALDTLQTFDRTSAPGHRDAKDVHSFFNCQSDLNAYIFDQLCQQRAQKKTAVKTVENWMLKLHWVSDHTLSLAIYGQDDARVDAVSACFDSDQPTLLDSQGVRYNLVGDPRKLSEFPADTPDAVAFRTQFDTTLLPVAQCLMNLLVDDWQQSSLLSLLNVLNAYAIVNSNIDGTVGDAIKSLEGIKQLKGFYHRPGVVSDEVEFSNFTPVLESFSFSHSSSGFVSPAYWTAQRKCIIMPLFYVADNPDAGDGPCVSACTTSPLVVGSPASAPLVTSSAPSVVGLPSIDAGDGPCVSACTTSPLVVGSPASAPLVTSSAPSVVGLPSIARGLFPSDVKAEDITWDVWKDCMVQGVGLCHVWNVYTKGRVFDDIAIQLVGTSDKSLIVNRTVHYDEHSNAVICTQAGQLAQNGQREVVHFESVCDSFAAWAISKGVSDYRAYHDAFFETKNLVLVECGGRGNCFYLSCMFLLQTFFPEEVKETTHMGLRTATVNHLNSHYKNIMTPAGPVHCLLPGASVVADDDDALERIVQNYCSEQGQSGEWVEDPCVHVFADLMNISITMFHTGAINPVEINPKAGIDARRNLTLWSDGNHYMVKYMPLIPKPSSKLNPSQAVVDKTCVTISAKGLKDLLRKNVVHCKQVKSIVSLPPRSISASFHSRFEIRYRAMLRIMRMRMKDRQRTEVMEEDEGVAGGEGWRKGDNKRNTFLFVIFYVDDFGINMRLTSELV
jgi:hypothetical protein